MADLPAYVLSPDGMTLVVKQRAPGGILTVTLHRQRDAGPFTDKDVAVALSSASGVRQMLPGQRNRSWRAVTRFGTVWAHVATGPPTWRAPRLRREDDGTLAGGWLRLAVAVRLDRSREDT